MRLPVLSAFPTASALKPLLDFLFLCFLNLCLRIRSKYQQPSTPATMTRLKESDDRKDSYRRIAKFEKEMERMEAKKAAEQANRPYVPDESMYEDHKSNHGWKKHPEDV